MKQILLVLLFSHLMEQPLKHVEVVKVSSEGHHMLKYKK